MPSTSSIDDAERGDDATRNLLSGVFLSARAAGASRSLEAIRRASHPRRPWRDRSSTRSWPARRSRTAPTHSSSTSCWRTLIRSTGHASVHAAMVSPPRLDRRRRLRSFHRNSSATTSSPSRRTARLLPVHAWNDADAEGRSDGAPHLRPSLMGMTAADARTPPPLPDGSHNRGEPTFAPSRARS